MSAASIQKHSDFCPPPKSVTTCQVPKALTIKKNSMKKKCVRKVSSIKKPKRYLSVYNIFFKEERKRIIAEAKANSESNDVSENEEENDIVDNRPKRGRPRGPNYIKKSPHYAVGFNKLAQIVSSRWHLVKDECVKKYGAAVEKDKIRYEKEMVEYKKDLKYEKEMVEYDNLLKDVNIKKNKADQSDNNIILFESQYSNSMKYNESVESFQSDIYNKSDYRCNQATQFQHQDHEQNGYFTNREFLASSHHHHSSEPYAYYNSERLLQSNEPYLYHNSERVCSNHIPHYEGQNNHYNYQYQADLYPTDNTYEANKVYSHLHPLENPYYRSNINSSRNY